MVVQHLPPQSPRTAALPLHTRSVPGGIYRRLAHAFVFTTRATVGALPWDRRCAVHRAAAAAPCGSRHMTLPAYLPACLPLPYPPALTCRGTTGMARRTRAACCTASFLRWKGPRAVPPPALAPLRLPSPAPPSSLPGWHPLPTMPKGSLLLTPHLPPTPLLPTISTAAGQTGRDALPARTDGRLQHLSGQLALARAVPTARQRSHTAPACHGNYDLTLPHCWDSPAPPPRDCQPFDTTMPLPTFIPRFAAPLHLPLP